MRRVLGRVGWYGAVLLVACLAVIVVAPFLYMISLSLMDAPELFRWPPPLVPAAPRWDNYPAALAALPFGRFFRNTLVVAGGVTAGQVATSAAAAYAFARLRFPGRDRIFLAFLAVLAIPPIVLLIPRFLMVGALGWVDGYAGLISTEIVSIWGIFLVRQFMLDLPRDLEDAARLDGAGEWAIFWRVVLPLTTPALAMLAVVAFANQWRSFLWPLVVTRSPEMHMLETGLATFHTVYQANWPYRMAAAVAVTMPVLVIVLFAQRYLVRGVQVVANR